MKIAFIGLGVMGFPMAGHLAAAGHAVTVFNRSPEKAERWVAQHGGAMSETAAAIFWNTGAQVGLVTWQTRMSPCCSARWIGKIGRAHV